MRSILLLFALILFIGSARAQHAGYKPVGDVASFKSQLSQHSQKINAIASGFKQQKTLTALTETITSEGLFHFKRPNKVRIEYRKPFSYLMIMNGDKMMVKDDGRENTMNLKSNKLFQQINRIIVDCIQGTILESRDFSYKIFENNSTFLIEMTPTAKSLKSFFQTIDLEVKKNDYSVESIKMNEPSGDVTIMTFSEKKINASIADQLFNF